jgi:hypothetical protein
MSGVLEETTSREIDKGHVVRRVDDWVGRIDRLYRQIEEWLPSGWTGSRVGTVRMHEELMQKFGVPPRDLPVMELSYNGKPSARIEPRGLWIIGENGRLDLFSRPGHYVIIDSAENFEPADWQIAPLSDRRNLKPLNGQTLRVAL